MSVSRPLVVLAILAIGVAACTAPAPGAPTEAPPVPTQQPPTAVPTPTLAAMPTQTAAGEPSATPTPASGNPDDYYNLPTPAATEPSEPTAPPEGGDATLEIASTPDAGEYLVGPSGLALYTFTRDHPGHSNCEGDCADSWPPLTVEDGEEPTAAEGIDGELGVITRSDGSLQVTLDNRPLYHFSSDQEPGDTNGEGVGGYWFLARP